MVGAIVARTTMMGERRDISFFTTENAPADRISGLSPPDRIPQHSTAQHTAYQIVRNELSQRVPQELDMTTLNPLSYDKFVVRTMTDALHIAMPAEDGRRASDAMAQRCVNILANLWHTPEMGGQKSGMSVAGSENAAVIAGVAALMEWRKKNDGPHPERRPNLIVGQGEAALWHRFGALWQVEIRTVPCFSDKPLPTPAEFVSLCDRDTICVVASAGDRLTGLSDNIVTLDDAIAKLNASSRLNIPIHVDASLGGMTAPFMQPRLKWDFRLPSVASINTSTDAYGLVPMGAGWIVWREKKWMDNVTGMAGEESPYPAPDLSCPASLVAAQYYQFLRLGFEGYRATHHNNIEMATMMQHRIGRMPQLRPLSTEINLPFFAFGMHPGYVEWANWTIDDLHAMLRRIGWRMPIFTLDDSGGNACRFIRLAVREGMKPEIIERLLDDIHAAVGELEALTAPTQSRLGSCCR